MPADTSSATAPKASGWAIVTRMNGNSGDIWIETALGVVGDALDPRELTEALETGPARAWARGEPYRLHSGEVRQRPTGYWEYVPPATGASASMEPGIESILALLERHEARFRAATAGTCVTMNCSWQGSTGLGGPFFSAEILRRMGRLGIQLHVEFCVPPNWGPTAEAGTVGGDWSPQE